MGPSPLGGVPALEQAQAQAQAVRRQTAARPGPDTARGRRARGAANASNVRPPHLPSLEMGNHCL